jgi:hypothetical protein
MFAQVMVADRSGAGNLAMAQRSVKFNEILWNR